MSRSTLFWILAFVITIVSAYYQRTTGPTYPLSGTAVLDGTSIPYKLDRSHGGESNAVVGIKTGTPGVRGVIEWKRYKTSDAVTRVPMVYDAATGMLSGELPHQPPAGKLEYSVRLESAGASGVLPAEGSTVIRFKGDVPAFVLIPHVIAMFLGMLFASRALLACFKDGGNVKRLTEWTVAALFVGGMLLGPLVQHYAFDAWWTGWPVATDLTDNKTAIAFIAWIVALVAVYRFKNPKTWVAAAAIVTFIVFLIPHSMFGSELKYENTPKSERNSAQ
ncbi:MAG TPA: hypothetical protein VK470_18505 [Bacteroidota bacterium]|nr:hypothetical protein [Bacteroidota bacterium]